MHICLAGRNIYIYIYIYAFIHIRQGLLAFDQYRIIVPVPASREGISYILPVLKHNKTKQAQK